MPMDLAISATTGAAPVPVPPPNARGDEQKVDAFKSLLDLLAGLLGSHLADLGIGPRSETARPVRADLYLAFFGNERHVERLHIRVHDEETRALDAGAYHVADGVVAAAAHAENDYVRLARYLARDAAPPRERTRKWRKNKPPPRSPSSLLRRTRPYPASARRTRVSRSLS